MLAEHIQHTLAFGFISLRYDLDIDLKRDLVSKDRLVRAASRFDLLEVLNGGPAILANMIAGQVVGWWDVQESMFNRRLPRLKTALHNANGGHNA